MFISGTIARQTLAEHVPGINEHAEISACKCGWRRNDFLGTGCPWLDYVLHLPPETAALTLTTEDVSFLSGIKIDRNLASE
jgi:hypothetical protein